MIKRIFAVFLTVTSFLSCNVGLAQTEVLTVQGSLPRLNYRDTQGNLLWSLPANNVLWKLDGPFNAGVIVTTAAARSGSITLNEGGVSIRGGGFPSAKLHVGTIVSATEPGEVRVDPGNPAASATIHAVNANIPTTLVLETQSATSASAIKLVSTTSSFSHILAGTYRLRDHASNANVLTITPSDKNNNAIVVRNGNIGLGVVNPGFPLTLASGAKCTTGGVWTNASSRELKHDIEDLSLENAREAIAKLRPVTYAYNAEPNESQAGFIAEEVPDLVATNTRRELSPMDFVAVLTKVVQDQDRLLEEQRNQLKEQAAALSKLNERLDKLAQIVDAEDQR